MNVTVGDCGALSPMDLSVPRAKGIVIGFWIVTLLFCLQIGFTAYAQLRLPQVAEAFTRLGFPAYFRVELAWAKLLGVVLLLAPVPARIKEWAYAGFAITLGSALIAHLSIGEGPEAWGRAAGTGVLWGLSYFFWHRLEAMQAKVAQNAAKQVAAKRTLLAGGNPQIAKGDGDVSVQAYIAAMPGWKRDVGRRLDAFVARTSPGVRKAVKWNSPFYGIEGQGWFLNFHCFAKYVKVAFFRGTSLRPVPPGESKHKDVRYLDIHEDDPLDEAQLATWIRQAAALPGWVP